MEERLCKIAVSKKHYFVAEGIERENQVESLRKVGCDMIQGYVYSKPLPVDEFEVWRNAYAK